MQVLHGIITGTSPASASTAAVGSPLHGMEQFDSIQIAAEVQGGTGGTLDLYVQASWDGGTTWWDFAHLPQLAAGAAAIKYMINAPGMGSATMTVIGKGTTPAMAVNTVSGGIGAWGKSIRVLAVAGASTSAGAAQTFTVHGLRLKH